MGTQNPYMDTQPPWMSARNDVSKQRCSTLDDSHAACTELNECLGTNNEQLLLDFTSSNFLLWHKPIQERCVKRGTCYYRKLYNSINCQSDFLVNPPKMWNLRADFRFLKCVLKIIKRPEFSPLYLMKWNCCILNMNSTCVFFHSPIFSNTNKYFQ